LRSSEEREMRNRSTERKSFNAFDFKQHRKKDKNVPRVLKII